MADLTLARALMRREVILAGYESEPLTEKERAILKEAGYDPDSDREG